MTKEYAVTSKLSLLKERGFTYTLRFLPLFILYIFIVLVAHNDIFWGDEGRYVMYANNLSEGYYSPFGKIFLWNGPGYPIVLLPFVILKLPWLAAKLLNPLFLFFAVLYFYSALCLYIRERPALFFSYLFGIYPPFMRYIHLLLSETIAVFLVCGFLFHFCKLHQVQKLSLLHISLASVFLGYLALTKVFFGFVVLSGLFLFLFLYIWMKRVEFKKTFLVFLVAILFCVPYLLYTYSLTGKIFYWGNSGGMGLYSMSSPYEDELGGLRIKNLLKSKNHRAFLSELENRQLSEVQRDDAIKEQAVKNIMNHPGKYLKNWMANVGRLLFNYPYAYEQQMLSTYFYIIPNMFLLVLGVICIYPSLAGSSLIPFEIYVLILFALIAFCGSSLMFAESRYFFPLVPLFSFWISFTLARVIKIELKS